MTNLAILTQPFESIDFELTDVTSWSERSGNIVFWTNNEVEADTVPIKDVLDFIEREKLNVEYTTTNSSYNGDPTEDLDHEYTHDPIKYLENNFEETVQA